MEVLKDLRHDLTLSTRVLLAHGSVHQLRDVLVEVRDKVLQVLLVCLRVQTLTPNPLHRVPVTRRESRVKMQ